MSTTNRDAMVKLAKKHGLDLEILPDDDPIYQTGSIVTFINRSRPSTKPGEAESEEARLTRLREESDREMIRRASEGMGMVPSDSDPTDESR